MPRYYTTRNRRHGLSDTPIHIAWQAMRWRCNPRNPQRAYYIDRGICVCEGWQTFETFLIDMGPKPSPKHSVDRIDNDGGYWCGHCPECIEKNRPANCRWATMVEQGQNTRRTRAVSFEGETHTIREWAAIIGLPAKTLKNRLKAGMPIERALTPGLIKDGERACDTRYTHNGETFCLAEWARRYGIQLSTLHKRIRVYGMSFEDALTRPLRGSLKKKSNHHQDHQPDAGEESNARSVSGP